MTPRPRIAVMFASALLLLVSGVACGQETKRVPPPTARAPKPDGRTTVLPKLELRADFSEQPARWHLVASIPFGKDDSDLGFFYNRERGSLPLIPRSFAVDRDGSFWILDDVKERIAHYSAKGRYIDSVPGFRLDRRSPRPKDIAVGSSHIDVLQEEFGRATLTSVRPDRSLSSQPVTGDAHRLALSMIFRMGQRLLGWLGGYADPLGTGPTGVTDLPPPARLQVLPGFPMANGRWASVNAVGDQDFELTITRRDALAIQPVHVTVSAGPSSRPLQGLVGPGVEAIFANAVGLFVQVAPLRQGEAKRFGGGVWYLRLGTDRSPVQWERLRARGMSDEEQVRHLSVDETGRVYLMVPDTEGEKIYTR